ncbi:MAG TPA: hypothetical protein VF503_23000 [Sphingobium sp.]|uniref:hypothetical protein n=1 Tax=Sphingobium sp. TaxID=1912891 RepID=UPI002ED4028C
MTDRYDGKPFLRLLDSYILDAIGHLDAESERILSGMEPEFRETVGTAGDWRTIVAEQMQFPVGMQGAVREVWDKGRVKFVEAQAREPDPAEFARIFVDSNFPR